MKNPRTTLFPDRSLLFLHCGSYGDNVDSVISLKVVQCKSIEETKRYRKMIRNVQCFAKSFQKLIKF